MAEYIDIDQPLIFKDIRNRNVTGTIRTILKANHTELVLADVVPVVRCKDCVYYDTVGCTDGFGWCEGTMVNTGTHDNFFCAEGKKKGDA